MAPIDRAAVVDASVVGRAVKAAVPVFQQRRQRHIAVAAEREIIQLFGTGLVLHLFLVNVFIASVPRAQMFNDHIAMPCNGELMNLIHNTNQIIRASEL